MSSQRELVQAMIRRRVSKAKKLKDNAAAKMDPRELVMQFLGEFNEKLMACNSAVEKYWLIESESQKLLLDIQKIDAGASIELIWFGDDISSMRMEGVKIFWSEEYQIKNNMEFQTVFDLAMILFD